MKKIGGTKIIGILGLALSMASAIASSVASDRKMKDVVEKVVDEKLKKI